MDKTNKTGAQDRKRINLDDEDELCAWAEKPDLPPQTVEIDARPWGMSHVVQLIRWWT